MAVWNPEAVRLVFNLQQGSRPMVNTVVVDWGGIPTLSAQLDIVAEQAYAAYAGAFMPLLADVTVLESVDAYSLFGPTAPVGHYVPTTPTEGGQAEPAGPLQAAAVLTLRTGGRGRSGRGRMYISGWTETDSEGSSLAEAPAAALLTAANVFRAALLAEELPLQVYSTQTGNAPRAVGLMQPVTAIELRTRVFGSQRDRNQREASA